MCEGERWISAGGRSRIAAEIEVVADEVALGSGKPCEGWMIGRTS
jgi:hypothetical protein